jgi:magnesium transporter
MLSVYIPQGMSLQRVPHANGEAPPEAAVWLDLVSPTVQEDKTVESLLGIAVPTR